MNAFLVGSTEDHATKAAISDGEGFGPVRGGLVIPEGGSAIGQHIGGDADDHAGCDDLDVAATVGEELARKHSAIPLREENGARAFISIAMPDGPDLLARIWVASVGRVPLLMLDSDIPTNDERARLKRDINLLSASALIEEKSYKPY